MLSYCLKCGKNTENKNTKVVNNSCKINGFVKLCSLQ